jgi:ATP-dependent DNA helicase RecG
LEILKASGELRSLRDKEIILQKGKGRSTYYIPNSEKPEWGIKQISAPVPEHSAPVEDLSEPVKDLSEPVRLALVNQFPKEIQDLIPYYTGRIGNKEELENFVCQLCSFKECSIAELSMILNKGEKYLLFNFIKPMREQGLLEYTHPEMPNHPQQAYKTVKTDD